MHTRRSFLRRTSSIALGFSGLQRLSAANGKARSVRGFGPLTPDPQKILDLPSGFSYSVIGRAGEKMSDGLVLPALPDGMAAFPGKGKEVILIRNHELNAGSGASGGLLDGRMKKRTRYPGTGFMILANPRLVWEEPLPWCTTWLRRKWFGSF